MTKKNNKKYFQKNKEKINALMRNQYQKHKDMWNTRSSAWSIVNGYQTKKHPIPNPTCKRCGNIEELRIHVETICKNRDEVRKAIDDGGIYYLCKNCK